MANPDFGTPAHMLTRTEDPGTSHAAGESVDTNTMEQRVLHYIQSFGQVDGCTSWQIKQKSGIDAWSISPRIAGLERKGYIYYQGDTRAGGSKRQMRIMRVNRRETPSHVIGGRRGDDPNYEKQQVDLF